MAALTRATLLLLCVPGWSYAQATLSGRIRLPDGSQGLADAEVSLPALGRRVITGTDGRYEFREVPAGLVRILVRRIGFDPIDLVRKVPSAGTVTLDLHMTPRPVVLDSVVVTGDVERRRVRLAEFERRRQMGIGTFRTREQLVEKETLSLESLLREFGISRNGSSRRGPASLTRGCQIRLVVDGVRRPWRDVGLFSVRDLEALEFYSGTARVPLVYEGGDAACGLLILWTRVG